MLDARLLPRPLPGSNAVDCSVYGLRCELLNVALPITEGCMHQLPHKELVSRRWARGATAAAACRVSWVCLDPPKELLGRPVHHPQHKPATSRRFAGRKLGPHRHHDRGRRLKKPSSRTDPSNEKQSASKAQKIIGRSPADVSQPERNRTPALAQRDMIEEFAVGPDKLAYCRWVNHRKGCHCRRWGCQSVPDLQHCRAVPDQQRSPSLARGRARCHFGVCVCVCVCVCVRGEGEGGDGMAYDPSPPSMR